MSRLREQNKQRTFEQIKQAARTLFERKGYAATTTREIAEEAQIATGTLFLYVQDKAELLILLYADVFGDLIDETFATVPEDRPLPDILLHIFGPFFELYGRHPENARHFLKELLFHEGERRQHQQVTKQNEELIRRLIQIVQRAQERGEIRQDVDPHQAAGSFFAIYFAAVTAWLGSFLVMNSASLGQLRSLFELQIRGMLPPDAESAIQQAMR
ncbi:TetR/AcrR family transcriptional regulator [Dictyobacter formicarum]|uniref:HTH tetR-type domain-containing protein n=1 Tax=Dictyobacter formicarum TaxID=2778368 RepID=A0ABQ3VRE9_9CHLR|nr:TetR/AcrR family transcriptional regulator [Dictyobacter formicarum]GHO88395.1 hypothetical protein KSZ_64010 [Dictyobacter formicarum]